MFIQKSKQLTAQQPRFFSALVRSQIVSVIATACDFGVLIFLTEVAYLWYLISVFFGAFAGGTMGFILGRSWAFTSQQGQLKKQATRYFIIWISNIILNVAGVYYLVDFFELKYVFAKIIVATAVGVAFSFPMQRYFVYVFKGDCNEEMD
jgi:putative flippase GtrA